jgi:hypothetical protein
MKTIMLSALAAAMLTPAAMPSAAFAQDWHHDDHGDHGRWRGGENGWDPHNDYRDDYRGRPRRLSRDDQVYRGGDGRYYCKRSNGTTGTVIGAVGGGLAGNLLGGGTLGTLLGAGGGALLGRSIDRGHVKCR